MSSRWKQGLLALPSVAFSMLPKLACPACWPAYAGLLTSVGLGFLISTVYLLPLTIAFLVLALGARCSGQESVMGTGLSYLEWLRLAVSWQASSYGSPARRSTGPLDCSLWLRSGTHGHVAANRARRQLAPVALQKDFKEVLGRTS
jgi:hypothetical protein